MTARSAPDRAWAWSGAAAFAAVVGTLKVLQAERLQNQAYDLGIYANVLWNSAHGRPFWDSLKNVNYLADHFSPGLAALAPLLRVWPSAAAVSVAQSAALALGLPAVHRLAWERTGDRAAAAGFALLYALSPLVQSAARSDAHAVAFGVPLLLWGLELRGRAGTACLAAAGTMQEDLWLCAAAAAWRKGERRAAGAFLAAFALALVAMRALAGGFVPAHWSFYDPAAVAASLSGLDRPLGLLRLLVPLGGLPLLAGADGLPLLLPLAYTWLGANPHQGRLDLQYGAPLVPFAFFAAIAGWSRLKRRPAWTLAVLALISCAWLKPYSTPLPPEKAAAARELFSRVPPDAPVCASFNLVPRLALRRDVCLWVPGRTTGDWWLALDASPVGFGRGSLESPAAIAALAAADPARVAYADQGFLLLSPPGR
jgi:uncharacterized membrane protein